MRGKRASIARQRVDLVIVSVRYEPDGRWIAMARGYQRRGQVWSDLLLYDRQTLVEGLKRGRRIVTGADGELAGDFEVLAAVRLTDPAGFISADGSESDKDDLGVPLF